MSQSVNKVILVGRLGRDPEIRSFQSGGKIANLRLATSESWKDRNSGERKERTEWHSVSIQNEALVKIAEQWLRKGMLIYVEGQLETRKWQAQDGTDRYSTEVTLRPYNGTLTMLQSANDRDGGEDDGGQYGRSSSGRSGGGGYGSSSSGGGYGGGSSGGYGDGYGGGGRPSGGRSDMDDEIPFAPEVR